MTEEEAPKILDGKNALENFFNGTENAPEAEQEDKGTIEEFFKPKQDEEIIPQESIPTPPAEIPKTNFYKNLLLENIGDGEWVDGEIELEDGTIVTLSEIEEITPELYKNIKAGQKELREEKLKNNYISIEGIDETTRKLIELKKTGGDISELVQMDAQFVNPLQGLDLDDEDVQEALARQKLQFQGLKPKFIDQEIEELKSELKLDAFAKGIAKEVNDNFNKTVEQKLAERNTLIENLQAEQKQFRKTTGEALKEMSLKDTLVKSLLDNTAKFDENGLTNVDKAFFALKKDSKRFAEIAFHILNPEEFHQYKRIKIKNDVTKDTLKTIFKISPKLSGEQTKLKPQNKIEEFFQT